jgi:starvation-inducible DNA-binding protein
MALDMTYKGKLLEFLATTYAVYLKTQNFHWNVKSPNFYAYHLFFEKQYEELAEAVDVIAERFRAIGIVVPASFEEFAKISKVKGAGEQNAKEMLETLLADHTLLSNFCKEMIKTAEQNNDYGTQDLFIERLRAHDKHAWMLQSSVS